MLAAPRATATPNHFHPPLPLSEQAPSSPLVPVSSPTRFFRLPAQPPAMPVAALHPLPAVVSAGHRRVRRQARPALRASSLEASAAVTVAVNGEAGRAAVERKEKAKEADKAGAAVTEEEEGKKRRGLEALYDDGFGGVTVKDYFAAAKAVSSDDGGPPRWFCPVDCGRPALDDAPLLLFLPGTDGVGMGLILHHKSLGKVFEVRCLHIPVNDRTPFEGLLQTVEKSIKHEHDLSPDRPIYIVGDSFGGCLAVAVAARNPQIDLVLILVNPATSFAQTPLQPILPLLESMPSEFHVTVPYLLSFVMGDPLKMASVSIENNLSPPETLQKLSDSLTSMLPLLSELADIIPRDTLLWKLKLLKTGAAYANSRLHAVQAEVLLLASGNDNLLPSGDEADRLFKALKNCRVRYFKDNGHTLLLEDGVNLLSVIKGVNMYRRGRQRDFVTNYLPPTLSEFKQTFDVDHKLFERNEFVLLYPGGVREALHRKGEEYKLFWPDQPEFVRMAARFGVTIIPFGCVGEDDVLELVLDYNDQKNIPGLREWIESINKEADRVRDTVKGENGNQDMYLPALLPKVPGRFYYLFGKPIEMKGMNNLVRDRKRANEVYLRIKLEVEEIMSYLKRKREEDPYRSIAQRALYQATWGVSAQVPTFEP
ncbi:hypothetical protein BS78_03G153200 [Paspalum vaginatum]|nr:hypothetical protein BS78_03G153200 [Paspalum vaginatum]